MITHALSRRAFLGPPPRYPWPSRRCCAARATSRSVSSSTPSAASWRDLLGTVAAVGKMGYQIVEFYAPYLAWTPEMAKNVRKVLDDSG